MWVDYKPVDDGYSYVYSFMHQHPKPFLLKQKAMSRHLCPELPVIR